MRQSHNQKAKIIKNIIHNTKLRLKPSKVCDGVGVFAILNISKGENLFPDVVPDKNYIIWDEIDNLKPEIKTYLQSMCNSDENGLYLSRTPNNINISYFINHSDNPNVFHDLSSDRYIAIRDIQKDEEILCTYTQEEMW